MGKSARPASDFPFTMSHDPAINTGAVTPGANVAFLRRFRILTARTYTTIRVYVTTQNGSIDAGIYSSDGTTATKLQTNGGVLVAAANAYQDIVFTGVPLVPGVDYYETCSVSGTAALLGVATINAVSSAMQSQLLTIGTAYPLPTTITLASCAGAGKMPTMLAF